MIVGYAMSSAAALAENTKALTEAGADKVFADSTPDRPRLSALLEYLRDGDTLMVRAGAQLADNLDGLMRIAQSLGDRRVALRVLSRSDEIDLLGALRVVASILPPERFKAEAVEGAEIAIPERAGRAGDGAGRRLSSDEIKRIVAMIQGGDTIATISAALGVSGATVQHYRNKFGFAKPRKASA